MKEYEPDTKPAKRVEYEPDTKPGKATTPQPAASASDNVLISPAIKAPYSIGKYVVNGASSSWKAENTHNEYMGIFKSHNTQGSNDWAYGHNRLVNPGRSKIQVKFQVPVEMI